MATHSSVLAWRIPGMVEPGGLPSMGRTELDMTEATQQQQIHRWSIRQSPSVSLQLDWFPLSLWYCNFVSSRFEDSSSF